MTLRTRLAALEKCVRETRISLRPFVIEVEDETGQIQAAELYTFENGVARSLHGEQAAAAWATMQEQKRDVPASYRYSLITPLGTVPVPLAASRGSAGKVTYRYCRFCPGPSLEPTTALTSACTVYQKSTS
jgi:hypothetical protein